MGRMEEILLILGIVILLFGSKKIPELAKGLGQGIREFKKASSGDAAKEAEKAKELAKPEEKKPDAEKKES